MLLGRLADVYKASGRELLSLLSVCRWLSENETVKGRVCGKARVYLVSLIN